MVACVPYHQTRTCGHALVAVPQSSCHIRQSRVMVSFGDHTYRADFLSFQSRLVLKLKTQLEAGAVVGRSSARGGC